MKGKIKLSEIAELIMGQSPDSSFCGSEIDGMPFLQGCAEFGKKYPIIENYCSRPKKTSPKGSILISVRAPVGKMNRANQEVAIGRGLAGIVAKNVDKDFLYYSVSQFNYQLDRLSQGSTFKAINSGDLRDFKINNCSLPQQKKIAQILSTCDAVLEQTEAAIAKYQALKQGMLHDLFTRGIDGATRQLRAKYEDAPELYKETELGFVPREWEVCELGDLTSKVTDGTHFTPTYTEFGIPFLRVTDVQTEKINFDRIKYVSETEHKQLINRCHPEKGDILYSKNGTIGIPKLVTWDWEFSIFVSLALIKPLQNLIYSEYLLLLLPEEVIWKQIRQRAKQGTVTNLHLEEIREFLIPLPSREEQELIFNKGNVLNKKIHTEQQTLAKYEALKAGLMQDLLSGDVGLKN